MSCQFAHICDTVGTPSVNCWLYHNLKVKATSGGDDKPHSHHILRIAGPFFSEEKWSIFCALQLQTLENTQCYPGFKQLLEQLTVQKRARGEIYS